MEASPCREWKIRFIMWYRIDILRYAVLLLPPILRSRRLVALLRVLTLPLRFLSGLFAEFCARTERRQGVTANVQSLEAMLNAEFFLHDGQIYIVSGEEESSRFWHFLREGQPPGYLYAEGGNPLFLPQREGNSYKESFVVYIPTFLCSSLDADEDLYHGVNLRRIYNLLNYYKPAGRTFRIELYEYE